MKYEEQIFEYIFNFETTERIGIYRWGISGKYGLPMFEIKDVFTNKNSYIITTNIYQNPSHACIIRKGKLEKKFICNPEDVKKCGLLKALKEDFNELFDFDRK